MSKRKSVLTVAEEVGCQIRFLLWQNGMTQRELSKRTKISQRTISRILNEGGNPTIGNIEKIANALNVDIKELF